MKAFEHNAKQLEKAFSDAIPKTLEALIAGASVLDEVYKKGGGEINHETMERMRAAWEALSWSVDV